MKNVNCYQIRKETLLSWLVWHLDGMAGHPEVEAIRLRIRETQLKGKVIPRKEKIFSAEESCPLRPAHRWALGFHARLRLCYMELCSLYVDTNPGSTTMMAKSSNCSRLRRGMIVSTQTPSADCI